MRKRKEGSAMPGLESGTQMKESAHEHPAELGFHMPAEWEPHEATWIAWPHNRHDWPGKFAAIGWVYAEIVRHLHLSERVRIVVNDSAAERLVRRLLRKVSIDFSQIDFYHFRTDRVWIRDSGPIFVRNHNGELGITDWKFNAWAKYPNWRRDDALPQKIGKALGLPVWQPRLGNRQIVLEGGSIDVNGEGLLLTTEECLLDTVQARNPGLAREDLEKALVSYLGVNRILWLGCGIAGDDTHGHIDDLARFVGPRTVVTVVEENRADPNYESLQDNHRRLRELRVLNNKPLEIVPLPMPAPLWFSGQRLPASYANFYIANDHVLVPTFNDPQDRRALGVLADLFPCRAVAGIHAVDLIWGLGTLHCMTQQQPLGSGLRDEDVENDEARRTNDERMTKPK
jgi:agmatine deiminase